MEVVEHFVGGRRTSVRVMEGVVGRKGTSDGGYCKIPKSEWWRVLLEV